MAESVESTTNTYMEIRTVVTLVQSQLNQQPRIWKSYWTIVKSYLNQQTKQPEFSTTKKHEYHTPHSKSLAFSLLFSLISYNIGSLPYQWMPASGTLKALRKGAMVLATISGVWPWPRMLTIMAPPTRSMQSPKGRPKTARKCCSNWSTPPGRVSKFWLILTYLRKLWPKLTTKLTTKFCWIILTHVFGGQFLTKNDQTKLAKNSKNWHELNLVWDSDPKQRLTQMEQPIYSDKKQLHLAWYY